MATTALQIFEQRRAHRTTVDVTVAIEAQGRSAPLVRGRLLVADVSVIVEIYLTYGIRPG